MIWVKTDAGRAEMQTRALVKERPRRNLLLLIDGVKSEEMLLANLAGIGAEDFQALLALELIVPAAGGVKVGGATSAPRAEQPTIPLPLETQPLDYGQFTAALTQLISANLGLRGFTLTLAVEKASTIEDLRNVAERALALIRDRKGEAAEAEARRTLYGG